MTIVELGKHDPSVASVIERLDRYQEKIKHISAIIEYTDGTFQVVGDTKDIAVWSLHTLTFLADVQSYLKDAD